MSLVARYLEAQGIPTVIIGSARDIVEECGAARFVFTDLPLGNPCGPPNDPEAHDQTIGLALRLLDSGLGPRVTVQSPLQWADQRWRDSYMRVDDETRPGLAASGAARRAAQERRRSASTAS